MELKAFVAKHVSPGQPLTAQAWNDIVTAVDDAYKFIQATTHVVKVNIINEEIDNRLVRVVATSAAHPPVEAVRPLTVAGDHVLVELSVGDWKVTAEAIGYTAGTADVTVADAHEQTVHLELQPGQAIMPDLFGGKLTDVIDLLTAKNITVTRLLDFLGTEIPAATPGPEYRDSPVLVQQPPAGELVDPTMGARLVIAVAPKIETAIEVPSLVGMTEVEARRVLEQLGLTPGKTINLEK